LVKNTKENINDQGRINVCGLKEATVLLARKQDL
jgi:hypothetical protein